MLLVKTSGILLVLQQNKTVGRAATRNIPEHFREIVWKNAKRYSRIRLKIFPNIFLGLLFVSILEISQVQKKMPYYTLFKVLFFMKFSKKNVFSNGYLIIMVIYGYVHTFALQFSPKISPMNFLENLALVSLDYQCIL